MLFALLACTRDEASSAEVLELKVEETQSPSVFRVSWASEDAGTGRVEYGDDGSFDHAVEATTTGDGRRHEALLAGLAAGEVWELRPVTVVGDEEIVGEVVEVEVPGGPDRIMDATVVDEDPERGGFFLATFPMPEDNIVALLDRSGRPTWWTSEASSGTVLQAWPSADGQAIEYLIDGAGARFVRQALTGEILLDTAIVNGHHSFVRRADGGYYALVSEVRTADGTDIIGDVVWSFSSDFEPEHPVWNAFDHLPLPTTGPAVVDWTHANELHMSADETKMLVSLHGLDAIVQIDLASGGQDWQLGGLDGDYMIQSGAIFHKQHGVRYVDGGLLIFDNGEMSYDEEVESRSRVVQVELFEDAAALVAEYTGESTVYVPTDRKSVV